MPVMEARMASGIDPPLMDTRKSGAKYGAVIVIDKSRRSPHHETVAAARAVADQWAGCACRQGRSAKQSAATAPGCHIAGKRSCSRSRPEKLHGAWNNL